jgi:hypothetical protein
VKRPLKERTGWSTHRAIILKIYACERPPRLQYSRLASPKLFLTPQLPLFTRRGINLPNIRAQFIHTFEAVGEGGIALIRRFAPRPMPSR